MADNPTPVQEPEETETARPPSRRRGILVVVIAAVVLIALGIWWRSTYYEDTDDAQVNGNLVQISTRVAGHVTKVYVHENQKVKQGDPILDLDPRDFQVAVEKAQAALASAEAAAAAARVFVPITTINTGSNLRSAQADLASARAAVEQAEQQLDAAKARVAQAEANNFKAQSDLQALQAPGRERRHQQAAVRLRIGCGQCQRGGAQRRPSQRKGGRGWHSGSPRARNAGAGISRGTRKPDRSRWSSKTRAPSRRWPR